MSSFVRKAPRQPSAASLSSTFDVRNQQLVPVSSKISLAGHLVASTGIASLDSLLGEGLPVGKILLVLEDEPRSSSNYANTILKCFLAQGLVVGNRTVIIGEDLDRLAQTLPSKSSRRDDEVAERDSPETAKISNKEKMSIAWRYKHIHQVQSELEPSKGAYGNSFDLGRHLDITSYSLDRLDSLDRIGDLIGASQPGDLLRIGLRSYGSPLFRPVHLASELYRLRLSIQACPNPVVCMITCPARLIGAAELASLWHLADGVIEIQSFAGTSKQSDPAFKDYQGFLQLRKAMRQPDSLSLCLPETSNLAFRCKQRRFIIEKFHLPPELGEAPSRTTLSSTAGSCASIDF